MEKPSTNRIGVLPNELLISILEYLNYMELKSIRKVSRRFRDVLEKGNFPVTRSKIDFLLFRDTPSHENLPITDHKKYQIHPAISIDRWRLWIDKRTAAHQYFSKRNNSCPLWSEYCTSPSVKKVILTATMPGHPDFIIIPSQIEINNPQGVTLGDFIDASSNVICRESVDPVIIHSKFPFKSPTIGFAKKGLPPWGAPRNHINRGAVFDIHSVAADKICLEGGQIKIECNCYTYRYKRSDEADRITYAKEHVIYVYNEGKNT